MDGQSFFQNSFPFLLSMHKIYVLCSIAAVWESKGKKENKRAEQVHHRKLERSHKNFTEKTSQQ